MTSRRISAAIVVAAAALLLTACAPAIGPAGAPTSTASPDPDVVGMWGSEAAGEPYLEFTAEGEVTGSDGCNGIGSTYTVVDGTVEIAPFFSTLKACQGVDDWLRGVSQVQVDGDTLIVLDKNGTKIGELPRT